MRTPDPSSGLEAKCQVAEDIEPVGWRWPRPAPEAGSRPFGAESVESPYRWGSKLAITEPMANKPTKPPMAMKKRM
jgi:hypothetical protein